MRDRLTSPETPALADFWTTLADCTAAALLLGVAVNAWAPPQDLPWKPLRLADPVGLATGWKFTRAVSDPARCRLVLAQGAVAFAEVPNRRAGDCQTMNTVRLGDAALAPSGPVMTCPLALGYAFWLRHTVQPAARAQLGAPIARVDHYGTYACRNVYGRAGGRRSEHASANALDVAGFRTAAGQRITVARDYREATAAGRFLRRVRSGACRWFGAVLGPDYNAAHRDHLHLDRGHYRVCR